MGWRDQIGPKEVVLPWLGGWTIDTPGGGRLAIEGRQPREYDWYKWTVNAGRCWVGGAAIAQPDMLCVDKQTGYLAGDKFIPDNAAGYGVLKDAETVWLINTYELFARVAVGRVFSGGPLLFAQQEFPLGPEAATIAAYEDKAVGGLATVKHATPALVAAFNFMVELDHERAKLRAEAERQRKLEAALALLGTAQGRRKVAASDFNLAAQGALRAGGAELIRTEPRGREHVVRWRFRNRRFECICDTGLRILDAGICLSAGGRRGDRLLTLESLPTVVAEAIDRGLLHVTRYV